MDMIEAQISERQMPGYDGTPLHVYVAGRGEKQMVLAPGLGTNILCWKFIIEHFQDDFTIMTWDPRATYRSSPPTDEKRLRVEDHVLDLEVLVEHLDWHSFVLVGWSMGVEIALEYSHGFGAKVRSLVLIAGAFEHVLKTAFNIPFGEMIFTSLLKTAGLFDQKIAPYVSDLFKKRWMIDFITKMGILTNNKEYFRHVVQEFSNLDFARYAKMILHLNQHSSRAYLSNIEIPTLIIAGARDQITPLSSAVEMHQKIKGSKIFVIEQGTHYLMIEYPNQVNQIIEDFLKNSSG